jgi:rhodanese-related sulfurtransferase
VRIALIDAGDGIAQHAAARLHGLGYTDLSIVRDGIRGWSDAGLTLFKGISVPSKAFGEWIHEHYHTPAISAAELKRKRETGEAFVLVDGRTPEEFATMTIPGAQSCPNGELVTRIGDFVDDATVPVIVSCAGRTRSIIGAQTLIDLGLPNPVYALENGTQGWALAGFELERGATRLPAAHTSSATRAKGREYAAQLARRHGVARVDTATARRWLTDRDASTYLFDVRSRNEANADPVAGATWVPGGQLVQNTDQHAGVRRSRILLVDDDGARASVIASWLIRMGYRASVVERDSSTPADECEHAAVAAISRPTQLTPSDVTSLEARTGSALHLLDVRPSAAFQRSHVKGAHWTIRPNAAHRLQALGASLGDRIVLIADRADVSALIELDLREAGYADVIHANADLHAWQRVGFALVDNDTLDPATRIDYLFFVHDRHAGNLDAARQYLAWEQGLVAQCSASEIGAFVRAQPPTLG